MIDAPPFSVYVHIPYCAKKCPYCDFNTYAVAETPEREYVEAVCRELARFSTHEGFTGRRARTIFFGGGTPSFFSQESIATIVQSIDRVFPVEPGAEVALEANPNHADPQKLRGFVSAGINRLSFGVQSFNERFLELLGRDHTPSQARAAVVAAYGAGIQNISVDIIFGVPGQTLEDLEHDLEVAVSLPVSHISAYSLTIEPGTPFFQRQERGLLQLPKDGVVAEMLELIPQFLAGRGFEQYEISNYARSGARSAHNEVYWTGGDYLGVGAGAHSYLARRSPAGILESASRWSTLASPRAYMEAVASASSVSWRETLDTPALLFEFFYLGLRRIVGVSLADVKVQLGIELPDSYRSEIDRLIAEGFLTRREDVVAFTMKGRALADSVFERLVPPR